MSLENVLSKNPSISDASQLAARKQDGVDKLYFDSDHSESPVSGENGRYHEVDGKDRITVKGVEGEETVTAQEFVSNDKFSSFGNPQDRLNLLNKASKYEIPRGQELKSAEDLKEYVNSLKPSPAKTKASPPPIASAGLETLMKANDQETAKNGDLKVSLNAKREELAQEYRYHLAEPKMRKHEMAEDRAMAKLEMVEHEMTKDRAIQNFAKSPSLETFKGLAIALMKY